MPHDDDFWQDIYQSQTKTDIAGADAAGLSILASRHVADAPLDAQFGRYPPLSTPAPFHAPLFGPLPGVDTPQKTYALVEAAKIAHLAERLETSGLSYASLFSGDAETDLSAVAPYLIALGEDHSLTRRFFTGAAAKGGLWDAEAAIFLRSPLDLQSLRAHLRHFTRLQDHTGQWYFFRYWDPKVAMPFFHGLCQRTEAARRWFETRQGPAITAILVPHSGAMGIALEMFCPHPNVAQTEQVLTPFKLQNTDHAAFQNARIEADVTQIITQVESDFADLLPEDLRADYPRRARKSLSWLMERGIYQKSNLLMLLVWDLAYGPDLFRKDQALRDILEQPGGETSRMLEMTALIEKSA